MEIRIARPEDASELLKIYAPYVEHTAISFEYTVSSLEDFTGRVQKTLENYPYLVVVEDGRILGYAYASVFHGRRAYLHSVETSLYVAEDCHRKKIGSMLYEALESVLREQNVINVYACITQSEDAQDPYLTDRSIRFHERVGYRLVGKHALSGYKFERWYSVVWMEKLIAERPAHPDEFIPFSELPKSLVENILKNVQAKV